MGRIKSGDVMHVVAIVAVIAIHSVPFKNPSSPLGAALDIATVINQMARFAVPIFLYYPDTSGREKSVTALRLTMCQHKWQSACWSCLSAGR